MDLRSLRQLARSAKRFSYNETYQKVDEATEREPNTIRIKSISPRVSNSSGNDFETAEVSLEQIGQAYYSDAYISRAINKIVGLMFKSGWGFSSSNKEALEYIEKRFRLMEESTHIKTRELLREIGLNFVLYANAPIIKVRGSENLADTNAEGYYGGEPIAALFAGSPEQFEILRDEFGNIESYRIGGNEGVEFTPEDIEHLTYQKPSGRGYGIPYITNSIRDVLILRQVEETVTNILYRNLHPLQVYTVGIDKPGMEAQEGEIDEVRETIEGASLDSMFVVPERHRINTISSGSDFLDATGYLKYFRQRVFTGLGVSESTMGIGDTANRSTSDNQSSDLVDLVKDFQQHFTPGFQKIIDELLFEGGYDPTLNPEDRVEFIFTEIEQSAKIARENHEIQKFMQNVQPLDITMQNMGNDPTTDYSLFYANLFGTSNSDDGTVDNLDQPENQYGKQDAPVENKTRTISDLSEAMLTDSNRTVMLHSDNDKSIENCIDKGWQQILTEAAKVPFSSEMKLKQSFKKAFKELSFNTVEDENNFYDGVSKQTFKLIQTEGLFSDVFYHYNKKIKGSYTYYQSTTGKEH